MIRILSDNFPYLIRKNTVTQAAKYFIVGGICTVLDFSLLYALTHFFNVHYVPSSIISFMSGTILNYYLCTWWIFNIRVVENRKMEMLYYILITGVGLSINTFLIYIFTEFLALYFMFSKLLATFVTYWWNFWARKYFLHTIK
jgi:putative flippase GtrA